MWLSSSWKGVLAYRTSQITIFGMPTDAEDLLNLLHKAESDPNAKAVVLFVDSPGGEAAASEALYLKIRKLAASKPVVAFVRGYGTSGAYMAILPSRRIVAANSSIVGSVGSLCFGDHLQGPSREAGDQGLCVQIGGAEGHRISL
jgi:protease-4